MYHPPAIIMMRYTRRNHEKLKLKLKAFGRWKENLSDLSSRGMARHIRVPSKNIPSG